MRTTTLSRAPRARTSNPSSTHCSFLLARCSALSCKPFIADILPAVQDLASAHYDPKSRSMREDPQPNRPDQEKSFKGDNFVRQNGDFAVWPAGCVGWLTAH